MDETDDLFDHYVAEGVLIPEVDEDGNIVYYLCENAEEVAPELYRSWMRSVEDEVIGLLEKGFVDVSFTDTGEPMYSLTELGKQYALGLLSE